MSPPPPQCLGDLPPEDLEHVLAHTRDFWEEIRGERLFITGGGGFFGTWLVESLLWANERLRTCRRGRGPVARSPGVPSQDAALGGASGLVVPRRRRADLRVSARPIFPPHSCGNQTAEDAATPSRMLDVMVGGTQHTLDFRRAMRRREAAVHEFRIRIRPATRGPIPYSRRLRRPAGHDGSSVSRTATASGWPNICAQVYAGQYGIQAKIARGFAFVGPACHWTLIMPWAISFATALEAAP